MNHDKFITSYSGNKVTLHFGRNAFRVFHFLETIVNIYPHNKSSSSVLKEGSRIVIYISLLISLSSDLLKILYITVQCKNTL